MVNDPTARAALLIGTVILAWTDVERDINRQVREGRDAAQLGCFADRKLSHKFRENLNEWLQLHVSGDDAERRRCVIRDEAVSLHKLRSDLAHNIWAINSKDEEITILIAQEEAQAEGQIEINIRRYFINGSELVDVVRRCEALHFELMRLLGHHYETKYPLR